MAANAKTPLHRIVGACGVTLTVFGVLAAVHAVRAGVSEFLYRSARYGEHRDAPARIETICRRAHALYPYNYYTCVWAGKTAFYRQEGADARASAEFWVQAGRRLNPHNGELTHLKAELLAGSSPREALALWRDYVDWRFWNPYNQFVLLDLASRVGEWDEAERALFWLQDTPYFKQGEAVLENAWRRSL